MLTITPLYVMIAVIVYTVISVIVIKHRRALKISVGDGGDPKFQRIVRSHGNFAEYVPMTLVCMIAAEASSMPSIAIHSAGVCLLLGRIIHSYCFICTKQNGGMRVAGMALTFAAMLIPALAILQDFVIAALV